MIDKLPENKTTTYQAWLNPALKRAGKSLKWLAVTVNMDYTSLWKIARGNPDVYPGSARPEHQNAVKIGEALGDVDGSLKAAGYIVPEPLATLDEVQTPDTILREFDLLTPEEQSVIAGMVSSLLKARGARS